MRTLTSAAQAAAAADTGTALRRILEVRYAAGTLYYAGETLTSPVAAEGRVVEWGTRKLSAEPGKIGGFGSVTVALADPDLALLAKFNTTPGLAGTRAYVHLWFEGTDWSDRVTEFGGVVAEPPQWSEDTAVWEIALAGFEQFFDTDVSKLVDRDTFPESPCTDCEGTLVPLAYGDPVARVPACVVDRPGAARLASQLGIHDATLEIHRPAKDAGFTTNADQSSGVFDESDESSGSAAVTLVVGKPAFFEIVTGFFDDSSDTTFTILTRTAIQAAGESPGTFGAGGERTFLVDRDDLPLPDKSRGGYPLYVDNRNDGHWKRWVVDAWFATGAQQGILRESPTGETFLTGARWKLGRWRTEVSWPTGTPVYEVGPWTYAVNFLPSKSVERVEASGEVVTPNSDGAKVTQFFRYAASMYTVNLDNRAYNAGLGRTADDPGITTVSLKRPPTHYGFSGETVYATVRGVTDDETPTGTPIDNPVRVVEHLLTSDWVGGIDSAMLDATSFTAAASATTEAFALAVTEPKKLNDLVGDLAQQAGCLLFWDQGKAFVKRLSNTLTGSVLTVDAAKYGELSLRVGYVPTADLPTEAAGKFKTSPPAKETRLVRRSAAAAAAYGTRRRELDLWAYQSPVPVASVTEFWLAYWLSRNQVAQFDVFLHALAVQPGDVVTLDVDSGAGTTIFDSAPARVVSVEQVPADAASGRMESIRLGCELNLWDWPVDAVPVPAEETCEEPLEEPDVNDPAQPTATNTSEPKPGQPLPPTNLPDPEPPVVSSSSSDAASEPDESGPPPGGSSSSSSAGGSSLVGGSSSVADSSEGDSSGGPPPGGSSMGCVSSLDGYVLAELPEVEGEVVHVLGLDADGCLVLVPVSACGGDSGGGSEIPL